MHWRMPPDLIHHHFRRSAENEYVQVQTHYTYIKPYNDCNNNRDGCQQHQNNTYCNNIYIMSNKNNTNCNRV